MPLMTSDFTIEPQRAVQPGRRTGLRRGLRGRHRRRAATGTALILAFPVEGWRDSARRRAAPGGGRRSRDRTRRRRPPTPEAAQRAGRPFVSLDHDGSGWPEVGQRDPVVGGLQATYAMLRPVCFYSAYEAVTSFVIGQRIARRQARTDQGDAGRTLRRRARARRRDPSGRSRDRSGSSRRARSPACRPRRSAGCTAWPRPAIEGQLDTERLRSMPKEEALAELQTLHGVGSFTAEGTLLRGCGVVDELPSDPMTAEADRRLLRPAQPARRRELAPDHRGLAAVPDVGHGPAAGRDGARQAGRELPPLRSGQRGRVSRPRRSACGRPRGRAPVAGRGRAGPACAAGSRRASPPPARPRR